MYGMMLSKGLASAPFGGVGAFNSLDPRSSQAGHRRWIFSREGVDPVASVETHSVHPRSGVTGDDVGGAVVFVELDVLGRVTAAGVEVVEGEAFDGAEHLAQLEL